MTARGYALDMASPVQHAATEMDRAAPAALSADQIAATYEHPIPGDLTRLKIHEHVSGDAAIRWLIGEAIRLLGPQVASDGNGGYRLAKPVEDVKFLGRKVTPDRRRLADTDERRALKAAYANLANQQGFGLKVAGARGAVTQGWFTLHPLARAIPQMSEKEFTLFAEDVKKKGVYDPILLMDGKIIDGRHRAVVASALDIPVRTEKFTGTEREARDKIVSKNVMRRSLTMAQRVLIVRLIFLPEAEAEAKERQRVGGGDQKSGSADLREPIEGKKAAQVAAERSAGLAKARSVEQMKDVDNAPRTQERVRSGEIKTVAEAAREAAAELGKEAAPEPPRQSKSAWESLGSALGQMRYAVEALEAGDAVRSDGVTAGRFLARLADIRDQADRAENLVQHQLGS